LSTCALVTGAAVAIAWLWEATQADLLGGPGQVATGLGRAVGSSLLEGALLVVVIEEASFRS
jgi:hypothetical protein